jgi:GDP-mannose transporter
MAGALNKLPVAISGMIFFDAPVTFFSVTAIFVGFTAGVVYTVAKIQQSIRAKMILPTVNPVALNGLNGNGLREGDKA